MAKPLTLTQKYRLHKEYKGIHRVVIYKGDNEDSEDYIEPNKLILRDEDIGGDKELIVVVKSILKEFTALKKEMDEVKVENARLHKVILDLLEVKGE